MPDRDSITITKQMWQDAVRGTHIAFCEGCPNCDIVRQGLGIPDSWRMTCEESDRAFAVEVQSDY